VPSLNANPVMVFDGHEGNVTSVGFQNESKWMYTGSEDTTIRIWDLRAKGFQRLFEATSPINSMVLAQNQVDLYSADQNGVIRIWDLTKSACKQHIVYIYVGCT
jgi:G protein beta subunit-like protein